MKYEQLVYTPIIFIVATLELATANKDPKIRGVSESFNHGSRLERIATMSNQSYKNFSQSFGPREEDASGSSTSAIDFSSEVGKCIVDRRYQILENLTQGTHIILNCFKAGIMLNVLKYLGESPKSTIKLFGGLLEFKKIPEKVSEECNENCVGRNRTFGISNNKKNEYIRMYKRAMQKLINEKRRFTAHRNQTQEERAHQLKRINENSQAFLSEVIRNLGDENVEKVQEEKLKKEITDPKLLSMLDVLSKNYMLKFKFHPGVAARMMRNDNGGFTFDLEIQGSPDGIEENITSDESSTREIRDEPQEEDYFEDDDDDYEGYNRKSRKDQKKKKKKEVKKKVKKLKKILPYLLFPMLIQVALLPFVFKKLFFLAMKALLAGKVALILVGFNLLRNTCIREDDDFHKIRVEHYGYGRGEEYGAWINGRSLQEPSVMAALEEVPFKRQKPAAK